MLTRQFGEIILASAILDPQGRNSKDRPVVIVTPQEEIDLDSTLDVVAITTLIPDPLPDDHVLLPWQTPRHPRTGLNKKCAAVGKWLMVIDSIRVIRRLGFIPGEQRKELMAVLERLKVQSKLT